MLLALGWEALKSEMVVLVLPEKMVETPSELRVLLVGRVEVEFGLPNPGFIEAGQKVNWRESASQYRSMMNLWNWAASKFEIHVAAWEFSKTP